MRPHDRARALRPTIHGRAWIFCVHLQPADIRMITELNTIIHVTGAELVISSSWRESHTLDELKVLLRDLKVLGKVAGMTP